jgi:hypothetical protein
MGHPFEKQREFAIAEIRKRAGDIRRQDYDARSEKIRQEAEKAPVLRNDESLMPSGNGQHAPTLQVPMPPFVVAPSAIPPGITHALEADFQRRNVYWQAYAKKSRETENAHSIASRAVSTFFDAAQDPDLGALTFSIGVHEKIDTGAATERELVPDKQPRRQIGTLFDEDNNLAIDFSRDGFSAVRRSVAEGWKDTKSFEAATHQADENLRNQMMELNARVLRLRATALDFESASHRLSAFASQQEGGTVANDIEGLKADAAAAAETVRSVFNLIAMFAHFGSKDGGLGDGIEKLGDLAASSAARKNDVEILEAQTRLKALKLEETRYSNLSQVKDVGAAGFRLQAAVSDLASQRGIVREALGSRKIAYGALGTAAANAVPSAPGKDKVAASMAAIPHVENVVAKASEMRRIPLVTPPDAAAARGLRIAHVHAHPSAQSFLVASDQLDAAREKGRAEEQKWAARRDQLFQLKQSMFGRRPGSTE